MQNKILELIDSITNDMLKDDYSGYIIDFLPQVMESSYYFEIEEYFLRTYLKEFADKIVRIVIKLLGYYPSAQIYLSEFPAASDDPLKDVYLKEENIRGRSIEELAEIITHIIFTGISSVEILLDVDEKTLISIGGEFSVDISNLPEDKLNLFKQLVEQENLFLRRVGSK